MISLMGDGQQRRSGSRSMNGNRIEGEPKSGGAAGRLLITGAGGFRGSHAVRHFASAGYGVLPLFVPARFPSGHLGACPGIPQCPLFIRSNTVTPGRLR